MLISQDRVEKALQYLAKTDLEVAEWKGAVLKTEHMIDVAESLAYKSMTEGTVEDKKRSVKLVPEVEHAHEAHFSAVVEFEKLKTRRAREVLIIDLFRTMEASRRVGNIQ